MNLVSSNSSKLATDTVRDAVMSYRKDGNVAAALTILTKLKGIGPATASLLLSVHDPTRVIFFSDEAFYWMCCSGKKAPIKYNAKEYQALRSKAKELADRLDVSATDIEKVAYVVLKQPAKDQPVPGTVDTKQSALKTQSVKRKTTPESETTSKDAPVRRSKRTRSHK